MKKSILVFDIGTSNIKAALFSIDGYLEEIEQCEISNLFPNDGWAETRSTFIINGFIKTAQSLLKKNNIDREILSISVVGNFPSIMFFDENNQVINDRVILWMDRRAKDEADILQKKYQKPTGPEWPFSKFLWVKRNEPETFKSIKKIIQPQDLIVYYLTGRMVSTENNLRVLGFNTDLECWEEEADFIGLSNDQIINYISPGKFVGDVIKRTANEIGLKKATPVIMGCSDVDAAVIGSGANNVGDGCIVFGTSSVLSMVTKNLAGIDIPDPLFSFPHPINDNFILRGVISAYGLAIDWFIKNMMGEKEDTWGLLEKIFNEAQKSCVNDLVFIPYLTGRLSTHGYKSEFGEIYNLKIHHNRGDLFRAMLNSLALMLADINDKCSQVTPKIKSAIIGGGGSRNDFFEKLKASACEFSFNYLQTHELTLLGAAILAAKGINEESSWDSLFNNMIHVTKTVEPDDKLREFFSDYKKNYRKLN